MVAAACMVFGGLGFSLLPVNLLPSLSYPSLTVQTEFANAAPAEVEQLITRPVEEVVGVTQGLRQIHSVSRPGVSEVTMEFSWDEDITDLAMRIRENLDRLDLPQEADNPIVLRYDPALDPIMKMGLSGNLALTQLRLLADKQIKETLERIPGVASVKVQGGEEEEIHINIDQGKVAAMGITLGHLQQLLRDSNINRPGGSIKNAQTQLILRTINEYDDLQEIRNLRINQANNSAMRLGDVAEVSWSSKEREEITRFDAQEGVLISIYKEGDANTVEVAQQVNTSLAKLQQKLPDQTRLTIQFDQSRFIQQSVNEVKQSLMFGGLLVILVLWMFLKNIKLTLIIATAIPLSIVIAFILMYRADVSLNIMSLGGLTLGVGMLVDSAIVVLESIHRRREQGLSNVAAAIEGTSEVGGAVVASVLTTIAVFLPIVFVEGIAGQLFGEQALTVTFSLLASLAVSFSLIPMLASLGKSNKTGLEKSQTLLQKFTDKYARLLKFCLKFKWLTVLAGFAIFAATLTLVPKIPTALIPQMSEGEFYFDVSLPEGTALPTTNALISSMEKRALAHPDVAKVYTSIGSRNVSGGLSIKTKDENLGQINIVIKDRANKAMENQVIEFLRGSYQTIPAAKIQFGRPSFFSLKTQMQLLFFGENIQAMREYTNQVLPLIEEVDGLTDIKTSLQTGNPELKIEFDRFKLARFGLTIQQVSEILNQRINGAVVSRFNLPDRQVDIRLRNREIDRDSLNDIQNIVIGAFNDKPITLSAVATITSALGPAAIDRIQQSRVAIISANLKQISLQKVNQQLAQLIKRNPPPEGISFEFAGQQKEMQQSFDSLWFAALLAVFLVYLVMAATFEHLGHPLVILLTIPLALIGVIWGLYISGYGISVISIIGAVLLVGVVVNNAIVLVDAINRSRRQGMEKLTAVVAASCSRLRPILITSCTTILGLLPMAIGFGEGSELRAPLAVVVSFGLVFATFFTLLIIPSAYLLMPSKVVTDEDLLSLDNRVKSAEQAEQH